MAKETTLAEENAWLRAEVAALREQLAGCAAALDETQRKRDRERHEAAALREVARTVGSPTPPTHCIAESLRSL